MVTSLSRQQQGKHAGLDETHLTFKQQLKYNAAMDTVQPTINVFHAIADGHRRRLLELLADGERPVHELAAQFPISLAAVSQHLRVLRQAGLVTCRAAGRHRMYRAHLERLRTVHAWTAQYQRFWQTHLQQLGHYLDTQAPTDAQP